MTHVASGKDEVEAKFQALVGALDRDVDGMVSEMLLRLDRELPAWSTTARPELVDPLRQLIADSIHAEIAALGGGHLPEELPAADMEFAREAARIGAPASSLSWGFRAGHALQWQRWLDLVDRGETDSERRRALLERGSAFFFAYADRMIQMVSDEYARERERLLRSTEQRRFHLVRELLDGAPVAGSSLDYDVDTWHIGMVVWGPAAGEALHALTASFGRELLLVGVVEDTYWAWLSVGEDAGDRHEASVAETLGGESVRVAIGAAHHGAEGFRRTHVQARDAHRVALSTEEPLTRYDDVALVVSTSGTTGVPKGAMLTATALRASADATHRRLAGPGRWLLALPAHHIAGLQVLLRSALAGTTPVALDVSAGFDISSLPGAVKQLGNGPRYASLVAAQLAKALESPEACVALASLNAVLIGGGPLPQPIAEKASVAGIPVVRTYGMSETAGGCVYEGVPLDGVRVRIDDERIDRLFARDALDLGEILDDAPSDEGPERSGETVRVIAHGEADAAIADVESQIAHPLRRARGGRQIFDQDRYARVQDREPWPPLGPQCDAAELEPKLCVQSEDPIGGLIRQDGRPPML